MVTIIAIVVIALAFDYINGFHDAANSIADRRVDARADAQAGR
jgi:phosphate/sulfate permease